ncbi:MAG: hypothetical protein ACI835_002622 [Planctomycetota bacterium]|jgi:uncharacterized protein (DUF58 family)
MVLPNPESRAQAALYRLSLTEHSPRGVAGERLGKGTGSSLEFQERRSYVAGDDVRHLDWKAYARTDQLMVRMYREEILPRIDLVIDNSRSIATEPAKAQLVTDLALFFCEVGRRSGFDVRPIALGDRPERLELARLEREGLQFDGRRSLPESLQEASALLRPGTLRLVLSDFLFPADPAALTRSLAMRASGMCMIQVLGQMDRQPEAGEALQLTDAETGEVLDLVLDDHAVRSYLERLKRLTDGLSTECRRLSGMFIGLSSTPELAQHCRTTLCRAGVIAPA